jgi:two-component system chemotaxis sensor kinase CheA
MTNPTADRVLALTGAMSVREAAQTKADVLAALAEPGDLLLDCAGVTQADLSFIQIILAAHRSARALGKRLALAASPVAALRQALERGGFAHPDAADPACWTGQGAAP